MRRNIVFLSVLSLAQVLVYGCGPNGSSDTAIAEFFFTKRENLAGTVTEVTFSVNPPGGTEFTRPNGHCEGPAGVAAGFALPTTDDSRTVVFPAGDTASTSTTTSTTLSGDCGNGVRDDFEECDDANNDISDGCTNNCQVDCVNGQADGRLDPGEECDDGNVIDGDACSNRCRADSYMAASISANGIMTITVVDRGGIPSDNDTPFVRCTYDGEPSADFIIVVESCFTAQGGVCTNTQLGRVTVTNVTTTSTTTTLEEGECGDGDVQGDEECDDDNEDDTDACSNDCEFQCHDGAPNDAVETGEQCDDGNNISTDTCTNECRNN